MLKIKSCIISCTLMSILLIAQELYALKILVCVTYFPAYEGRFILNQIIGLIDAGHDVTIFAKQQGPSKYHSLVDEYKLFDNLIIGFKPKDIMQYDIILCQFGYRGSECADWFKKIPKKQRPLLVTFFRGADISKYIKKDEKRYDFLFSIGDVFLPVCEDFKKRLIRLACPQEKIIVLHSGIDSDAFSFKPKKLDPKKSIIVTSVCRLVEKKGIEYVIHALASVVKDYPQIKYWIIGEGPLKESLMQDAINAGLQEQVTFWGRQPEDVVIDLLHKSHIFILPSIVAESGDTEGIPNALKEAIACGVPVIATDHAGNRELIGNEMGIMVPEKNTEALVEGIYTTIQTYNSGSMSKRLQEARNNICENFSMESTNKQLLDILDDAFKRRKREGNLSNNISVIHRRLCGKYESYMRFKQRCYL